MKATKALQEVKDTNPKRGEGDKKVPLGIVPPILVAYAAVAFHEGKVKYGANNWRAAGASTMTYLNACKRHLDKFTEGEEFDPLTGVPHLGNALACIGIILDARMAGKLEDDRPPIVGNYSEYMDELSKITQHLTKVFEERKPRHYTIKDDV